MLTKEQAAGRKYLRCTTGSAHQPSQRVMSAQLRKGEQKRRDERILVFIKYASTARLNE